jgi:hypothetical protein
VTLAACLRVINRSQPALNLLSLFERFSSSIKSSLIDKPIGLVIEARRGFAFGLAFDVFGKDKRQNGPRYEEQQNMNC